MEKQIKYDKQNFKHFISKIQGKIDKNDKIIEKVKICHI